jgi:hypothetical protein
MGTWKSGRGYVSDEMADILAEAFDKIGDLEFKPTMADLVNSIELASRGAPVYGVDYEADRDPALMSADDIGNLHVKLHDGVADILRDAFNRIAFLAGGPLGGGPRIIDLADGIEFVSRGSLLVEARMRPGDPACFAVVLHPVAYELGLGIMPVGNGFCFETIPNRGQIH